MKRFNSFLTEGKHDKLRDDFIAIVKKSLNTDDITTVKTFLNAFTAGKGEITALSNDVDVFDFYTEYRTDIDEILSDEKYYDQVPSENGVYGLYDYVVAGTKVAIKKLAEMVEII